MTSDHTDLSQNLFLQKGEGFYPVPAASLQAKPRLPGGTYTIKKNPQTEALYFAPMANFTLPKKIYGNSTRYADRIFRTFLDRTGKGTGLLLAGEKGSGKTLLAKSLSVMGVMQDVPTIVIYEPIEGDTLIKLLQTIDQPAIVLFDEFEKVYYDNTKQDAILTLLDGTVPQHKLFILTVNDKYAVNQHMRNRPGRLFYSIDYHSLDIAFIQDYANDVLTNQATKAVNVAQIIKVGELINPFNFDMLQAWCEEINRYDESAIDALELLNIKQNGQSARYAVTWESGPFSKLDKQLTYYGPSPQFVTKFSLWVTPAEKEDGEEAPALATADNFIGDPNDDGDVLMWFNNPTDLVSADASTGTFVYVNKAGVKVTLTKTSDSPDFIHLRELVV